MEYAVSFGTLTKADRARPGPAFRLAVLGDFSGRANAGIVETGAALAARKSHKVDVDNLDALLERLSLTLSVPVDEAGGVISVPIRSMDDFHPDQLVENLPFLQELVQLRRDLASRAGFDRAAKKVLSWSGETALPRPSRRARGTKIATDRKLSDFARLTGRAAPEEAAADDLIRRLVGPFVVPSRDSRQDAMIARVDEAMSDAMRRVLHHPDFQSAEALWRGLEFLVRRIETDAKLQIVLYDISAEELAADLAANNDLTRSSLYSLLVEQPAMDVHQGPLSMLTGLYEFEVTPPHAELLGRMAQIAAAAGAPFTAGVAPDFLKTPMHDWHPLIKQAWTALRELRASAYLALASPRFLLRMPYGKKTDPIDAFAFEEFTRQGGLSGMLWGHPALLTANLLAETWKRDSKGMKIGGIATVPDLPIYIYYDTDGEQIALPCTERLFSERQAAQVSSTGVNPVISLRGRPEVRMGGFASLAGGTIAGQWAPVDMTPPPPKPAAKAPPSAQGAKSAPPAPPPDDGKAAADLDELDAMLGSIDKAPAPPAPLAAKAAPPAAPPKAVSAPPAPAPPAEPPEAVVSSPPPAAALKEPPVSDEAAPAVDDLDALMAALDTPSAQPVAVQPAPSGEMPAAASGDMPPAPSGDMPPAPSGDMPPAPSGDDLDAMLAGLDAAPLAAASEENDLDALLASLNPEPEATDDDATEADLDALLASLK